MKKTVKEFIDKKKIKASKRVTSQLEAANFVSRYIQLYEQDKIPTDKYRNLMYGAKIYSEIMRNQWIDNAEKRLKELESYTKSDNQNEIIFEGWN